jgi:hypothetical protein
MLAGSSGRFSRKTALEPEVSCPVEESENEKYKTQAIKYDLREKLNLFIGNVLDIA